MVCGLSVNFKWKMWMVWWIPQHELHSNLKICDAYYKKKQMPNISVIRTCSTSWNWVASVCAPMVAKLCNDFYALSTHFAGLVWLLVELYYKL